MASLTHCSNQSNTLFRHFSIAFLALLLLILCGTGTQAAPGDLDLTFGTNGKVITPISSSPNQKYAVAIQPDGKIVAAGYVNTSTTSTANNDFALARYNTDGTLDTSFGTGGMVTTPFGTGDDRAYAVAIQPDGKIVAAGYAVGSRFDFAIARYNTNGSLDSSFGTGGKVTTDFSGSESIAYAVAIQPDGKIVAAGYSTFTNADFALARYNTDGALDTSFNTTGKVSIDFDSSNDFAYAVAIQPNGKIVAAGSSRKGNYDFALARYNTNGTLDTSFDIDGKVTTSFGNPSNEQAKAVAIQSDGKIVAAGYSAGSTYDFALARYDTNGTLDTSFDIDGKVTTDFGTANDFAYAAAIQVDGKIVVAGLASIGSNVDFALARYNTNGTLDNSFNGTGKVTTDFDSGAEVSNAIAIQSDGKIVTAGNRDNGSNLDFALARYHGTATITTVNAGDVIISEFRFSGPNANATDEFVELYNTTNNDIMVNDATGGAGWLLLRSNSGGAPIQRSRQQLRNARLAIPNTVEATDLLIPNGTVLPAHCHFLIANTGYSLSQSGGINRAFPDLISTFDMPDNGGIALFKTSLATGTRLDAVGFSNAGNAQFYEGTPLTVINPAGANEQYSFIRKINNEVVQDTNNNAADFLLISTMATVGSTSVTLGAPGPENLFAPVYKSPAQISGQYLDPTAASTAQPNRVIESGILKIRRSYTNNTGADVKRLRFRVFDLTTLNNTQGVPAPVADLRVISSQTETLNTAFGSKTALAMTREEPPDQTTTLLDGGLHTTLSADTVTLTNPLRVGQSINVAYWLRVVAGGRFRFFVNIEATP